MRERGTAHILIVLAASFAAPWATRLPAVRLAVVVLLCLTLADLAYLVGRQRGRRG